MQAEMKHVDNTGSRKGIFKSDVLAGYNRKWACLEAHTSESNGILSRRGHHYCDVLIWFLVAVLGHPHCCFKYRLDLGNDLCSLEVNVY